jgi:hypothetical protein
MLYGVFRRKFHNTLCESIKESEYEKTGRYYSRDVSLVSKTFPVHEWIDKTPDLYSDWKGDIHIIEVSISRNPEFMIKLKQAKYEPTVRSANEIGMKVIIDYFIWEGSASMLDGLSRSDLLMELWELDSQLVQLGFKDEDVDEIEMSLPESYFKKFFENRNLPEPSMRKDVDSQYVEKLASAMDSHILESDPSTLHRYPELSGSELHCREFVSEFSRASFSAKPNRSHKKVLQLGFPSEELRQLGFDEKPRIPYYRGGFAQHFNGKERGLHNISVTPLEREAMIREGPGRKAANKDVKEKKREEPTHLGIVPDHLVMVEELISKIDGDPEDSSSRFGFLLSFYQRVSVEMIMNLMKKRKGGEFLWFSSGFEGIWVCASPGPPLRTESNVMFVKIVSTVSSVVDRLSVEWKPVGDHFESGWLSVDTERLTHWSRCRDRLLLTYRALSTQLKTGGTTASTSRIIE